MQSRLDGDGRVDHPGGEASAKPTSDGPAARACDQCRARKVRCDRTSLDGQSCSNCIKANVTCDASARSTRVNHTKRLVDDFASMGSRLDNIDAVLLEMASSLNQHQNETQTKTVTPPITRPPSASSFAYDLAELQHFCRDLPQASRPEQSFTACKGHRSVSSKGFERYHGPTAMSSLFHSSRETFETLLDRCGISTESPHSDDSSVLLNLSDGDTVTFVLRKIIAAFPFQDADSGPELPASCGAISRPPRQFLDASLDFYFRHINPCLPLFDEHSLRSRIDLAYNGAAGQSEEAHSLCFTNIILMALGAKLRFDGIKSSRQDALDDGLFVSLFENACRAASSLDSLQKPNVIHVQALASLALVAAEYFADEVFDKLVTMACRLASVAGLREAAESDHDPAQNEHRRLFWSLYCLDKRCVFLMGRPCDIYLFDSALELPVCDLNFTVNKCTSAQLHLMSIWEQISISLYSHRAQRQEANVRAEQVARLDGLCEAWKSHYDHLLAEDSRQREPSGAHYLLELRYYYFQTQVLIHRCGETAESRQKTITQSRAALRLLVDIYQASLTPDGIAVLGRLFRFLPPVAFHHLVQHTAQSANESGDDMLLLRATMEALSPLLQPSTPKAYTNQLHAGMTWCNIMVKMLRQMLEKDRYQEVPRKAKKGSARLSRWASHSRLGSSGSLRQPPTKQRLNSSQSNRKSFNGKQQGSASAAVQKSSVARSGRAVENPRDRRRQTQRQTSQTQPTNHTSSSSSSAHSPSQDSSGHSNMDLGPNWDTSTISPFDILRGLEDFPVSGNKPVDFDGDMAMGLPERMDTHRQDGHQSSTSSSVSSNPADDDFNFPDILDRANLHDNAAGHQLLRCPAAGATGATGQFMFDNMGFADATPYDQRHEGMDFLRSDMSNEQNFL